MKFIESDSKFHSIYLDILDKIHRGTWEESSKLPSERQLIDTYNTTRITLREALRRCELEGLIYCIQRKGWYIAKPKFKIDLRSVVNYTELALEQGFTPNTKVISVEILNLEKPKQMELSMKSSKTIRLFRIRSLDQRVIMAEEIFLDPIKYPNIETKDLNQLLTPILNQDYQTFVSHETSHIQLMPLSSSMANILGVNPNASCFHIIRERFNDKNHSIDYNVEYWLPEAVEFHLSTK